MAIEASRVADQIVTILQQTPSNSLLGSGLSVLLKARCLDFNPADFGSRNLREFIRANVPQVYESSRQGLDVVYTLSPVGAVPQQRPLPAIASFETNESKILEAKRLDDELWKTYVSPSGPYRLFVDRESNEFQIVGVRDDGPASPRWVQVPPCSAARHRSIAQDFVASLLPGEAKARLAPLLAERVWWIAFFEETRRLDIEKQWLDFRRAALFDELRKTLSSLGIERANLADLKPQGGSPKRQTSAGPFRSRRDLGQLRSLAVAIVSRINESELRELRFRLGDVLDALANR